MNKLFKAWCRLTKRYEFTHASNAEEARENIIKKLKFKNKLYYIKDEDLCKPYEHKEPKPLEPFRIDYHNVGDASVVFKVYVIAKSDVQAMYYLRSKSLLPIYIDWCYGKDADGFKLNHPEEVLEEGKVIATW